MKKLFMAIVMCLCLLFGIGAVSVLAEESGTCGTNVTWVLDDEGTLTISGTGTMKHYSTSSNAPWYTNRENIKIVVVEEGVTNIGNYAFYNCNSLTSVTIPEGVKSIYRYAFSGCERLISITIPDSVKSIYQCAFYECSGLTRVNIGNGIKSISDSAFNGCSALKGVNIKDLAAWCKISFSNGTSNPLYYADNLYLNDELVTELEIPDSVTSLGSFAFNGCGGLTSVTIPYSVTSIGYGVFYGCNNLTSVTIPGSVRSIDEHAFDGCNSLNRVNINDLEAWCKISFSVDYNYFITSNPLSSTTDLYLNNELVTELEIPEGLTSIGSHAFDCYGKLTSITIPNSVTSIGEYAFRGCNNLTDVYYLGTEEEWANVTITDSYIYYARIHCIDSGKYTPEEEFEFVNGVITKYVGERYVVDIPPTLGGVNVRSIADRAFESKAIIRILTIPDSLVSIGNSAFYGCSGLKSINIPNSVTSIGNSAFYNCRGLNNINIPDSVTSIGSNAFEKCYGLKNIIIPNSVTKIGEYTFQYCDSLTDVVIPDSVTVIERYAFRYCDSLTNVKIPDSVTSVGAGAFYECSSLTSVAIGNGVRSIGSWAFEECSNLMSVNITDIEAWCKISFSSNMSNPLYYAKNLYLNDGLVTELEISNSLTSVKSYAFYNCSNLTSVTIPDSVNEIGKYAFYGCSNLTEIIIPENIKTINSSTFYNCYLLDTVYIPESVTKISDNAFYGCYSLSDVYYSGSKKTWEAITINSTGNDALSATTIHYEIEIPNVYTFITNGGTTVETITGEISEEPVTIREGYDFIGWYDNKAFAGEKIIFPYSGEATTLYARWWPVGEEVRGLEYTINSIKLRDISTNNEIESIPKVSFLAEINVTNASSERCDVIMIVSYDKNGSMLDMDFVYADLEIGEAITFGSLVKNVNGEVYAVKAFVRPRINSLVPLAESMEISK